LVFENVDIVIESLVLFWRRRGQIDAVAERNLLSVDHESSPENADEDLCGAY
jgi:hypothetical protein